MKKKKLTYLLIPLVILLWGIIIYKIVATKNTLSTSPILVDNKESTTQFDQRTLDTFSIHPTYRDPFLGTFQNTSTVSKKKTLIAPNLMKKKAVLAWPRITYGGLIKNQKSNKTTVLLTVNGKVNIVSPGGSIGALTLLSVSKDSITVNFKDATKTIKQ